MPAVRGARAVQLLAQRLHQRRVALDQSGPAAVGEGPVERVARVLHRGRVLVVDVDAVEAVRADEVDRRVGEGVDAGLVDRAVGLGGHGVEAAGVHAGAVVREVAARLGPAAHRDHRLDVGVLLLELGEQVEVALVGQARVRLGARHPGPRHPGRRVLLAVGADGEPVAAVDVREGVVDVGDLVPRDVRGEVGRLAVLARAPAGEVADHPARVVGAHLLPARRVVDRAVGDADPGRLVEPVGTAGLLAGGLGGGRREAGEQQTGNGGGRREQGRPRSVAGSGA